MEKHFRGLAKQCFIEFCGMLNQVLFTLNSNIPIIEADYGIFPFPPIVNYVKVVCIVISLVAISHVNFFASIIRLLPIMLAIHIGYAFSFVLF